MIVATYLAIALASVVLAALFLVLSIAITDRLEALHNARSSRADEDRRAVEFCEFGPVHKQTINSGRE